MSRYFEFVPEQLIKYQILFLASEFSFGTLLCKQLTQHVDVSKVLVALARIETLLVKGPMLRQHLQYLTVVKALRPRYREIISIPHVVYL